jgi:sugar phosphate isomerase/epimerase
MTLPAATIPLSLAHLSELAVAPPDLIDLAARAGFASVGLRVMAAAPGGIEYPLRTAAEQAEMRRRIAATGVSVLYVEMVSLSRATRARDCVPLLETGAAVGASRLAVAGDDADFDVIAERMAELCDLALPYGIAVDLEFMPFRPVQSLAHAATVVRRAGRANAHILVDALHVFRSGSSLAELATLDPALLGTFQLCDAARVAPQADALLTEARTNRLLPGAGGLDLRGLMLALPASIPYGVELPIAGQFPTLSPIARATMMVEATRAFLKSENSHASTS